jgi:DNA-binding transcriptional regulator YiaG
VVTLARRYRTRIAASVHEAMSDLYEVGLIDKRAMRRFDASCLSETCKRPKAPRVKLAAPRRGQTRRV